MWLDSNIVGNQTSTSERQSAQLVSFWLFMACCFVFSPTAKLAMGSLAQNSSGAIGYSCNPRFRRRFRKVVEGSGGVQMADEVPDGSGADSRQGSGRLRCRWLMRFRMVPVSIADTVLEGSGAESWWGSGGFRAESWLGSGGFRCRWLKLMRFRIVSAQIADKVPKVLVQIADKVLEGAGAESWWSSGGFRCRKLMRFRRVAGQIADEVLEGSGTHSNRSSGGFRYKNIPKSSKLLGITHGFIQSWKHNCWLRWTRCELFCLRTSHVCRVAAATCVWFLLWRIHGKHVANSNTKVNRHIWNPTQTSS